MLDHLERFAGKRLLQEGRALDPKVHRHIFESAYWLDVNYGERLEREQTFVDIIGEMNEIQDFTGPFRDVGNLKNLINNEQLPTLGQITAARDETSVRTLEDAKRDFPLWANVQARSRATPMWGVIIEGYGMYVGKKHGGNDPQREEDIRRTFVLAFEAVACVYHKDSKLVDDVIDWMTEERESFPPEIANQL